MNCTHLLLSVALAVACSGGDHRRVGELEAKIASLEADVAARERERVSLEAQLAELRGDNRTLAERAATAQPVPLLTSGGRADCSAEVASAEAEARRWREGLEKAVEALNDCAGRAPSGSQPATPAKAAPEARVSTMGAPVVQIIGNDILVTGRLWNGGDGAYSGSIDIELMRDNRAIDSATEPMAIGPRTDVAYSHRFWGGVVDGATYSARVVVR